MSEGGERMHLYLCRPHWVTDPDHLARCHDLLDEAEKARHARFKFERDARLFLVSHALVRTALSDFAANTNVHPAAWRFETNAYGRPRIMQESGAPGMHFSLSHTHGLAACVVAASADVGVDAEAESRNLDMPALAPRIMSPSELSRFQSASVAVQRKQFLSLWTLKESFTKARGLGLSLPVEKLGFFVNGHTIHFGCPAEVEDKPGSWEFRLMQPTPEHYLSLVTRFASEPTPALQAKWYVPLVGERTSEPSPALLAGTHPVRATATSSPC